MDKKLFGLLIALMTLALLGIVFVQWYWISSSYETKEAQFVSTVRQVLLDTAGEIELREAEKYFEQYNEVLKEAENPESVTLSEIIYKIGTTKGGDSHIFSDGILEEDFKLSSSFLDTDVDSILFKKITSKKVNTKILKGVDGGDDLIEKTESFNRLKPYERAQFEDAFSNISAKIPIHRRVSANDIEEIIEEELSLRGIKSKFQFAVYSNDLATKVRTERFDLDPETTFVVSLFDNTVLKHGYQLYVNFYQQDRYVFGSLIGMTILSLLFTSIIFITFYTALSQLFKQRQISQIKNDFINNMTHEFKTPIATINLALDALKNPKVKENEEFSMKYLRMIRDENKRMHEQVENVLRISKLDKNELDLPKERYDLHDVIEDSMSHIELIVEDRKGYINTHLGALKTNILVNESHITNVIVNILDNAVKYSEGAPKIDIYTENIKNFVILKIRDQGIGMSKSASKKIFEKFYRVPTGDIHNIKGHGLGLSYVKRILDDHDAKISVESDLDKGSTFIIKLHLIS